MASAPAIVRRGRPSLTRSSGYQTRIDEGRHRSEPRALADDLVELFEAALLVREEVDDVLADGGVVALLQRAFVGLGGVAAIDVGDDVDDDLERRLPLEVAV